MTQQTVSSQIPSAALLLGLAGLIPFAAGAASQWVALPLLTPEPGLKLIIAYGAIILSFLGGIRWGTAIGPYDSRRQGLEFTASVLGSLAGLAAIFIPPVPALTLLISGFLMQGLWDVTSVEAGRLPSWFGKLRMLLTAGAVISLIAALVAVIVT
ncbi:MAG: DUF3429 domain-containing protein [Aestuariivirga sp.]|jgi:hypothetical protein|nr:DUF3429 domain-containing protein [Aestuariivirga sp.]